MLELLCVTNAMSCVCLTIVLRSEVHLHFKNCQVKVKIIPVVLEGTGEASREDWSNFQGRSTKEGGALGNSKDPAKDPWGVSGTKDNKTFLLHDVISRDRETITIIKERKGENTKKEKERGRHRYLMFNNVLKN